MNYYVLKDENTFIHFFNIISKVDNVGLIDGKGLDTDG